MPEEIICATVRKGWYEMTSSKDERRVKEAKCTR
jgi:hypothetical protein